MPGQVIPAPGLSCEVGIHATSSPV